jgi:hypothetical protein
VFPTTKRYEHNGQKHVAHGCVVLCTGGFGADFSDTSLLSSIEKEWRWYTPAVLRMTLPCFA